MSDFHSEPGPGEDPFSIFFKGFPNTVKASEVSDYFYNKGYHNHIAYQKVYNQHFRLFMALRFQDTESAKEVREKYTNTILFGYKVHLSFFKKHFARIHAPTINNIFMQDKLRKLRAQATRRPLFYRTRFHGHYSPVRVFRPRTRRRSRSSSSGSDCSISPDRKRRDRSRDGAETKRRRRSHSRSRSSRSTSRSETPTRFSPNSSHSKRSSSNDKTSSYPNHVRKLCSKVTVVENNQPKKFSDSSQSSKERSQEHRSPTRGKPRTQSPSKDPFLSNFSPVSFGSDDDAMLMTPTPEPTTDGDPQGGAMSQKDQLATSYFAIKKAGQLTEAWIQSEGDSTPDGGGTPSPRGSSLAPKQADKERHSVSSKVGPFTEIRAMDRPWQLKPLTVQDECSSGSASSKHTDSSYVIKSPSSGNGSATSLSSEGTIAGNQIVMQTNRTEAGFVGSLSGTAQIRQPSLSSPPRPQLHPIPHEGTWSPGSSRLQSPSSSLGATPPKVNGVRKGEVIQTKLERLQAKKEEIIRAYKQDCDTFATVVRMLIRKDPELEQRLQQALRENLTEIGQRCVQELQEMVEQIKD
ncbi:serine/arginine repetitive matrix protein 1-like isoform X2 [Acanthaster planci]|uniref:Serine/arginine repetitive matrix protein 1-like isoform X2 n=1 Tax=Acanthaster planci TaxID=133434 RepID=A0A8B7XKQ5_ACAPL|nr:serine/arginine repetitive matrix protein 1-like isoform X2 [Acanthaster planci]